MFHKYCQSNIKTPMVKPLTFQCTNDKHSVQKVHRSDSHENKTPKLVNKEYHSYECEKPQFWFIFKILILTIPGFLCTKQ